jgi:lipoprotein-releasing system permease protein
MKLPPLSLVNLVAYTHLTTRLRATIIAALGVTFGISMFIFMLNFVQGLNNILHDLMVEQTAHVHIYQEPTAERPMLLELRNPKDFVVVHNAKPLNKPYRVQNGIQLLDILRQHPEVRAASPKVTTQVFFTYGPLQVSGNINGIDTQGENAMFNVVDDVVAGRLWDLDVVPNALLMGIGLARKLGLKTGDWVQAVSPAGVRMRMKIVGIIQTGYGPLDNMRCYTTIRTAQRLMNQNSRYITDLNFKLVDNTRAPEIAEMWQRQYGYKAESWQEANASALTGDRIRTVMFMGIVIVIMIVAGFGIYNVLTMMIREKMKDIAILKAMGASGADVRNIFLREAVIIGILGGLVGLVLGYLVSVAVEQVPMDTDGMLSIDHLPMDYDWRYYVAGFVFGVLVTAIAGYLPARKAAQVDPISILRG